MLGMLGKGVFSIGAEAMKLNSHNRDGLILLFVVVVIAGVAAWLYGCHASPTTAMPEERLVAK